MKKFLYAIIIFMLLLGVSFANDDCDDCKYKETWTQEMFTELVTFLYTDGEAIATKYGELYNITIQKPEENDVVIFGHLGLWELDGLVVLVIEAVTHDLDGTKLIDHNFYSCYFMSSIGQYYYLPQTIDGNMIVTKDLAVLSITPKISREFKEEGYKTPEWLYWMGLFYEYMQTEKAKGRNI